MPNKAHDLPEQFAGCLLYTVGKQGLEVLLVHPSGKSKKRWTIPQVVVSTNEDFEEAARAEVAQETGLPTEHLEYLGYVRYPKRMLHCFYGRASSKHAELHSLEINGAQFFAVKEAEQLLDKRQQQLLHSLRSILAFLEAATLRKNSSKKHA